MDAKEPVVLAPLNVGSPAITVSYTRASCQTDPLPQARTLTQHTPDPNTA